jgi:NADH-quinone oxidoreductase subunit G
MTTTAAAPPSDTVTLTVDGHKITVKKGTLLVEAAKKAKVDIPVFCYHDKLKPVGACRMCLVEIEKMPRLQTACTTPVAEGMVVRTQSELAKGGQNSVLALLLANHPLDCPVCDKGGECPLQDNTFGHGLGESKFEEDKRHNDKAFELSDQILLDRERCILCYRCVRFHEEIPGDRALAVLERGGHGQIGVLDGDKYDSPFQGNTIDICPVGALTSRQYRFRARPWDLTETKSIACDDPVGSNLWLDTRDGRVLRIRPRDNLEVNDVWIADRTRFGTMPAERVLRLQRPLVRKDGALVEASWVDALGAAVSLMRSKKVGAAVSPTVSSEAMGALAALELGDVNVFERSAPAPKGTIAGIAKAKSIVVVGLDPWTEIPMLALWIHRAVAQTAAGPGGASLVALDEKNGLFRDTKHWVKAPRAELRAKLKELVDALEGNGSAEMKKVAADLTGKPSAVLVGTQLALDPEAAPLLEKLYALLGADGSAGLVGAPSAFVNGRGAQLVLKDAAQVDAKKKEGVFQRAAYGDIDTLLLVGDVLSRLGLSDLGKARAVWFAHSLPKDIEAAGIPGFVDVVLPLAHPYEQAGSYVSCEGRAQGFDAGGVPPGESKADWLAVVMLAREIGVELPLELSALRKRLSASAPDAFSTLAPNRARARAELSIV